MQFWCQLCLESDMLASVVWQASQMYSEGFDPTKWKEIFCGILSLSETQIWEFLSLPPPKFLHVFPQFPDNLQQYFWNWKHPQCAFIPFAKDSMPFLEFHQLDDTNHRNINNLMSRTLNLTCCCSLKLNVLRYKIFAGEHLMLSIYLFFAQRTHENKAKSNWVRGFKRYWIVKN